MERIQSTVITTAFSERKKEGKKKAKQSLGTHCQSLSTL